MRSVRRKVLLGVLTGLGAVFFTLSVGRAEAECTVVPGVVTDQCAEGLVSTTTVPPSTTTTAPPPPEPGSGAGSAGAGAPSLDTGAARRLVELANQERRQRGAPSLTPRADVAQLAADHSRAMAADGRLRHNDAYFTAAVKQRLGAQVLGENVAMNPDVDDAHRRLMASPGHRANLVDPRFTVVGFAVVRDGSGQLWVTQAFVQPAGTGRSAAAGGGSGRGSATGVGGEGAAVTDGAGGPDGAATAVPAFGEGPALPRAVLGRRGGGGRGEAPVPPRPPRALVLAAALLSLTALATTRSHLRRRRPLPGSPGRHVRIASD